MRTRQNSPRLLVHDLRRRPPERVVLVDESAAAIKKSCTKFRWRAPQHRIEPLACEASREERRVQAMTHSKNSSEPSRPPMPESGTPTAQGPVSGGLKMTY
jgi:hypothetical protein